MSTAYRIAFDASQEVGTGSTSTATGLGTVVFDNIAITASYYFSVFGLDFGTVLGGAPTTVDPNDDVTAMHVHSAARGANGPIAFDLLPLGINDDADDFATSANLDGSRNFSGIWETTDPANTSLNTFAAALGAAAPGSDVGLYFNIHSTQFAGGVIRAQLVAISDDNANTVVGTNGADRLPGLGGADTIAGGAGDDIIDGGTGDDFIDGGIGNDTIEGGAGVNDFASYAGAASGVLVNLGLAGAQNTLAAGNDALSGIEHLLGSAFNDVLLGDAGANDLRGGAGDDVLDGRGGNDIINGDAGFDIAAYVFATAGVTVDLTNTTTFQATGGGGSDLLLNVEAVAGSAFNDVLTGSTGVNALFGGAGFDVIKGGAGFDLLGGGSEADYFLFDRTDSITQAPDIIVDFAAGVDKLDFRGMNLAATDRVSITTGVGGYSFVDVDLANNGSVDFRVLLAGNPAITRADLVGVPAGSPSALGDEAIAAADFSDSYLL